MLHVLETNIDTLTHNFITNIFGIWSVEYDYPHMCVVSTCLTHTLADGGLLGHNFGLRYYVLLILRWINKSKHYSNTIPSSTTNSN